jgi:lipopolysaccharide/colanic/teichoic acid biosynthesis glycosyltransferase
MIPNGKLLERRYGLISGKEDIFYLYKFRSMTDAKDENGSLLSDDIRLTKFGRLLRSTSMDELPEVINILKGDSGIIGTTKKNLDFTGVSLA